ncbi:MAG: DedA family protein [Candidatus Pacebacteria bacterium]|nr:DedA family protein [Candidatus Paceibacterota bacterium]
MAITEIIIKYITNLIASGGYFFVFLAMFLEGIVFPIPSEVILAFTGFLVAQTTFSFSIAIIISALGSFLCALAYYLIGYFGFKPFILKYGKYVFLKQKDIEKTESFFTKHGSKAIFISRFIPIIRQLGALPAGGAKMNFNKFSLVTILGALIWNGIFIFLGYLLGENWPKLEQYTKYLDYIFLTAIIIAVIIFIYKRKRKRAIKSID